MTTQISEQTSDLAELGWGNFFTSQLLSDALMNLTPARVKAVHRNRLEVIGVGFERMVPPFSPNEGELTPVTVGDWLLLDVETFRPLHLLERKSLVKRRAVGKAATEQLIAANIDTLFIVTSCNLDFNVARLERYLALAHEAGVIPVLVLTKADLAEEGVETYLDAARELERGLVVEVLDARDKATVQCLAPWCGRGQTVAFVGSSGVGKSTLINSLKGGDEIATGAIREDDAKGRHTTTGRTLYRLAGGGWLVDTPGMRELQLTEVEAGIEEVFADLIDIAAECRFSDCQHQSEPGCAIQAAMASGVLEEARYKRWQKLRAEDARNTATLAERRDQGRKFGKMVKKAKKDKAHWRDD
ncbi:MAG: ribosome small subunit-dependent GTPase A [Alphaproteobacteria bacterium]|nr:ribosome small subunit-dependent GTPase A [Rhodobiaceae bacterium]MBO6541942.1 ribosome small subunit-dependent GTPase A [Alphaproteobacteria bacterium]MBO6628112.1 ribosome small subunit-dependent GTPase A [Alphaproteobacteria bacterium]